MNYFNTFRGEGEGRREEERKRRTEISFDSKQPDFSYFGKKFIEFQPHGKVQ